MNMSASRARSHLSLPASLPMTGWMFNTGKTRKGLAVELLVDQYHSPVRLPSSYLAVSFVSGAVSGVVCSSVS